MNRKGRVAGVVLLLGLFAMLGPAGAAGLGSREFMGAERLWAALWHRAVCFVDGGCIDQDRAQMASEREGDLLSIFAENGSCIDPNGSPRACAETQGLEPKAQRDR